MAARLTKAGRHESSCLVIKTDLAVVLQRVGRKVRVHVTDAEGRNVRGAYVTVSDGKAMRGRGLTDGRGIYDAPGVGATPFVVVSAGGRRRCDPVAQEVERLHSRSDPVRGRRTSRSSEHRDRERP